MLFSCMIVVWPNIQKGEWLYGNLGTPMQLQDYKSDRKHYEDVDYSHILILPATIIPNVIHRGTSIS